MYETRTICVILLFLNIYSNGFDWISIVLFMTKAVAQKKRRTNLVMAF